MDVFIAESNPNNLYLNDGAGTFTPSSISGFSPSGNGDIAFEDVDNDNFIDIVTVGTILTGTPTIPQVYLNDGSGTISIQWPQLGDFSSAGGFPRIAMADIDNDNDIDVVICGWDDDLNQNSTNLYLGDGSGGFSKVTASGLENVEGGVNFVDIDNDNDQDLLVTGAPNGSSTPISKFYMNDGNGNFTENTNIVLDGVNHSSILFFDFDSDNDLDLFYYGVDINSSPVLKLYKNNPSVGIAEQNTLNMTSVYPNPTQGLINVRLEDLNNVTIEVINLIGQTVYIETDINTKLHQFELKQASGIYIVNVTENNNKLQFKLILDN